MSDVTTTAAAKQIADAAEKDAAAIMAAPPGSEPTWAKPAVAIFCMVLLGGALGYAVLAKDHDAMMLILGAIISMATSASSYYLGSSSGSARKTELAAGAA